MPNDWNLRYDEWIIGDGEPDRAVGDIFDWFAVEFWSPSGLAKFNGDIKSAAAVANFEYQVTAEVVCLSERGCILDFGLRAVGRREALPPECREGDYVEGRVGIGIPHGFDPVQIELLKDYRWKVNRISADLTPLLPEGVRYNYAHAQYQPVDSTTSVEAHSYILHCSEVST